MAQVVVEIGEWVVYRVYGIMDYPIYIGKTNEKWYRRLSEHDRRQSWANQVFRVERTAFPDEESALDAERHAIETEKPIYNKRHNGSPEDRAIRISAHEIRIGLRELSATATPAGSISFPPFSVWFADDPDSLDDAFNRTECDLCGDCLCNICDGPAVLLVYTEYGARYARLRRDRVTTPVIVGCIPCAQMLVDSGRANTFLEEQEIEDINDVSGEPVMGEVVHVNVKKRTAFWFPGATESPSDALAAECDAQELRYIQLLDALINVNRLAAL